MPNGVYNPAVMFRDADKRYAQLLPNLVRDDVGSGMGSLARLRTGRQRARGGGFRRGGAALDADRHPDRRPPAVAGQAAHPRHRRRAGRAAWPPPSTTAPSQIWPANGGAPAAFKVGEGITTAVAFAPDGKRLATAGIDGAVRLWAPNGTAAGTLPSAK